MVDNAELWQVSFEYFGFIAKPSTDCSTLNIIHHYPEMVQ
jgi:hypothetical protein